MLVTRQCDIGRNTWTSSKLEAVYRNAASPRMSNFEPLSAQPDWREQYSAFPLPVENGVLQPSFEQGATTASSESCQTQQTITRPTLEQRDSVGPTQPEAPPVSVIERPGSAPGDASRSENTAHNDSVASSESKATSVASLDPNLLSPASSVPAQQAALANIEGGDQAGDIKDDDDEDDDDDDMLDAEDGSLPQTAAERRAERRKMKRFRLTHQQTRFLMSEFAKQAHPDAAHRERLSGEIPGLSPRQVQVWFQNRRAKIKRLTADDRERMMRMRAVPDDFDNVQALHSPYGAVHGIGTPMQSPVDFVPAYSDHMMRPLMVDTMRRHDHEGNLSSPTGLSPAFSNVGFAQGGPMNPSGMLSPASMNSNDRYYSDSHLASPMSTGGPRSSNPFDRPSSYGSLSSRQPIRPLQPLQLRETMSRTRSSSIQSPLRSSMSWKGETLDYNSYQPGHPSPQLSGRQQSVYQPDQTSNPSVNAHQYDGTSYPNPNLQNSPPHITFPPSHGGPPTSMQPSSQPTLARQRTSSAFPPGLDLRNQYRPLPNHHNSPNTPTPRSSSFASAFTAGYASAPLTAPVDFSLPRTPGDHSSRDFHVGQLSAPIAPPQEYTSAYNNPSLSPNRAQQHQDAPNRSGAGFGGQSNGDSPVARTQDSQCRSSGDLQQGGNGHQHQSSRSQDDYHVRTMEYETGQKRKRSYTLPGGTYESP